MRWLGVARRAFDMMCERSLYRPVKGGLLKDKQTVQSWIADSAAEMQAARLMTLHAAWKIDQFGSSAARTDVSMIKFFGAKVLHDVVDRALQLHGGLGYSTDMPLEMLYRYARHARFVDGADEVHRESVARQILRAYEAPEDGIPTEHVPTRRAAAREKFADVLGAGRRRRLSRARRPARRVAGRARASGGSPFPSPGPGEVLLKIAAAGLCHSDLHIMEWPEGTLPWRSRSRSATRRRARSPRSGAASAGSSVGEPVVVCAPWGCGTCLQLPAGAREPLRRTTRAGPAAGSASTAPSPSTCSSLPRACSSRATGSIRPSRRR